MGSIEEEEEKIVVSAHVLRLRREYAADVLERNLNV